MRTAKGLMLLIYSFTRPVGPQLGFIYPTVVDLMRHPYNLRTGKGEQRHEAASRSEKFGGRAEKIKHFTGRVGS